MKDVCVFVCVLHTDFLPNQEANEDFVLNQPVNLNECKTRFAFKTPLWETDENSLAEMTRNC